MIKGADSADEGGSVKVLVDTADEEFVTGKPSMGEGTAEYYVPQ